MRHIISALMENESGALSRVAGLFSARGYNIESLTVAPTEDSTLSRMTLVTSGDENIIEQITKQLNKLMDVVKLVELTEGSHIERELMMIKVKVEGEMKSKLKQLSEAFDSDIIDESDTSCTVEITGDSAKLDAFIASLDDGVIIETVRSGPLGIARGEGRLSI
tara:strand:+ start:48335 stop:48826 length:492 start_codon:yes stop_codon:yes gene_type:complete